jgi:hypothetical protein
MNSYEAKKLNLPEIMSKLGHNPVSIKKRGNEFWYHSPFRKEKDASFHTSYLGGKWIWNDFADSGGTVIDFIMRHENLYSVSDALSFLEKLVGKTGEKIKSKSSFSFQKQISRNFSFDFERELEFISAKSIKNPIIISYLTEIRGLDKAVALIYLKEIRYKNLNNNREYFAFGMKNESDGYEIRVASDKYPFKSALIQKDISFVKGAGQGKEVNIFEGMTDFLALLTLEKKQNFEEDSIVMHSLSSFDRTVELVKLKGYSSINTYLDNDKSGLEFNDKFIGEFGVSVTSQSNLYKDYKDIAQFLKKSGNYN